MLRMALSAQEGGISLRYPQDQRVFKIRRRLLALHEVLVGEVADAHADGQVEGEEGVGHGLAPQLPGDDLLVEDLGGRGKTD